MNQQSNQENETPTKQISEEQRTRNTVVFLAGLGGAMAIVFLLALSEAIEQQAYQKLLMLPVLGFGAFFAFKNALRMK